MLPNANRSNLQRSPNVHMAIGVLQRQPTHGKRFSSVYERFNSVPLALASNLSAFE